MFFARLFWDDKEVKIVQNKANFLFVLGFSAATKTLFKITKKYINMYIRDSDQFGL